MYDNDSKGFSYTGGFFMLIAFAVAGLIMSSLLGGIVWTLLTGTDSSLLASTTPDPAHGNARKIVQTLVQVLGFFAPTVITAALIHKRPLRLLGFRGSIQPVQLGVVILIVVAAIMFASSLSYFTHELPIPQGWQLRFEKLEEEYSRQVSAIVSLNSFQDYVISLFIMAFIPALCEETLFRGGLQNFLTKGTGKPWLAIIVVSIIFSLVHFSFYGFLSRLLLGIVLGALYHYSGRLWVSVIAHFINNAAALTAVYIYTRQGKPMEQAMAEDPVSLWGIVAMPALVGLFILFRRVADKPAAHPY